MPIFRQRTALLAAAGLAVAAGFRPGLKFESVRHAGGAAGALLPYPAEVKFGAGSARHLELTRGATVALGQGLEESDAAVSALRDVLSELGLDGQVGSQGGAGGSIRLVLQGDAVAGSTAEQGYHLNITDQEAVLTAQSSAGLFYGVQTLRQLVSHQEGAAVATLPPLEITDAPRFVWRGLHLDVSRHFFAADEVKKLLRTMSLFKLNRFHWHLTDDQGWRLPVEGYPLLTEVGGEGQAYTKEELLDVVAFAQARHIQIIPEIDLPGHVEAALAAYPNLGNSDISGWTAPRAPREEWGISEYTLAPSDATWALLDKVFDTLAEIFPSKIVHIGGDEVSIHEWMDSPAAKQSVILLQNEELAELSAGELSWQQNQDSGKKVARLFNQKVVESLKARGRKAAAWDEAQHTGNFPPDGIVMAWRSMDEALQAVQAGRQVVVASMDSLYFDFAQGESNEPPSQGGCISWQKVYGTDPMSFELRLLPAERQSLVLGAQGQLWSEHLPNWTHVEYMAHPRSMALAEKTWSPEDATKDLDEFESRLRTRLGDLDRLGVNYRGLGDNTCAMRR